MAGTNSLFNPDTFRNVITDTMMMGLPNALPERPTFRWTVKKEYNVADPAGKPYNWKATPVSTEEKEDVQIPVAVEFSGRPAGTKDTIMGQFNTSYAILTILDIHHVLVEGADQVVMGGNTYRVLFVEPPIGLFSVTVYRWHTEAMDES